MIWSGRVWDDEDDQRIDRLAQKVRDHDDRLDRRDRDQDERLGEYRYRHPVRGSYRLSDGDIW